MKKLFTSAFLMLVMCGVYAQDDEVVDESVVSNASDFLSQFSFTSSIGAPSFNSVSIGELNVSYKLNPKLSLGISAMGSLGDCLEGYYNLEGQFVALNHDDDDDLDEDMDNEGEDDDDDEACESEGIENIMGTITLQLSDQIPVFVQVSGGYSLNSNRPAYSAFIGYTKKVFADLGIVAGLRYSDILYKIPSDAASLVSSSGFKAELGINWNF